VFTPCVIGTNNVTLGDRSDTVTDAQTTGIAMWSVTPYQEVVASNTILREHERHVVDARRTHCYRDRANWNEDGCLRSRQPPGKGPPAGR